MGLWNWIRTQAIGVDLDAEQKRSDELDAQISYENQKDYGPGGNVYKQTVQDKGVDAANQQYEDVTARENASHIDVEQQVGDAFNEGLQEGFDNVTGGINKALKAPFKFAWASIPWQVWLVGAALLFFYMGGGAMLKGILKRR